jgi:hypothetical protein
MSTTIFSDNKERAFKRTKVKSVSEIKSGTQTKLFQNRCRCNGYLTERDLKSFSTLRNGIKVRLISKCRNRRVLKQGY